MTNGRQPQECERLRARKPRLGYFIKAALPCAALLAAGPLGVSLSQAEQEHDERVAPKQTRIVAPNENTQQSCANVAAAASIARNERQQRRLWELEQKLKQRLSEFDARRTDLQKMQERIEAFTRKTDDTLVELYGRMRPEAAAEQLANLDEESAASLLLHLKPKSASAIMSLMEATNAAALIKKISKLSAMLRRGN